MPTNYVNPSITKDHKGRPIIIKNNSVQDQMIQTASKAAVTSPYGDRVHPRTKETSFHTGVDLVGAGVIILRQYPTDMEITYDDINGLRAKLTMSQGTLYIAHLMTIIARNSPKGFLLGIMGNSGRSTGLHAHVEFWQNGKNLSENLEDPLFRESIFASL